MKGRGHSTYGIRIRGMDALARGMGVGEVARAYGMDRTTVYRWTKRLQSDGEAGLKRRPGSGRPRKLQELDAEEICEIVLAPASDYGFETDLWTVRRVHQVVIEEFGIVISMDTIWRRLREVGLTYQKPERQYFEIDREARERWLREEVPKILATARENKAILYFQDECNVSLTALLGKTWAPCGGRAEVSVTGKRGSVAAMSAVSRRGHLLFALHQKRIASAEVIEFLGQMLRHHPQRHLVVVMDQAPPHTSKRTKCYIDSQRRLHVFYLPKYSPDWNPDEKVWNHLKHHELQSHQAKTTDELTQLTKHKMTNMANNPKLMRGIFFRCCVADLFG